MCFFGGAGGEIYIWVGHGWRKIISPKSERRVRVWMHRTHLHAATESGPAKPTKPTPAVEPKHVNLTTGLPLPQVQSSASATVPPSDLPTFGENKECPSEANRLVFLAVEVDGKFSVPDLEVALQRFGLRVVQAQEAEDEASSGSESDSESEEENDHHGSRQSRRWRQQ